MSIMTRRGFTGFLAASACIVAVPALAAEPVAATIAEVRNCKRLLIDIREAEEWIRTGVPQGAKLLSMNDFDFDEQLQALTGGDRNRPVALLCRTGVRAESLRKRLKIRGYSNVTVIEGGLLGDGRHVGWIAAGLPVEKYR